MFRPRTRSLILLIILAALSLLTLTACDQEMHTVRYEVDGTATEFGLTYRNETGGTEQINVTGDWQQEYTIQGGNFVAITVVNRTLDEEATVNCRLYIDGELIQSASSQGALKSARCSSLVGLITPTPPADPNTDG